MAAQGPGVEILKKVGCYMLKSAGQARPAGVGPGEVAQPKYYACMERELELLSLFCSTHNNVLSDTPEDISNENLAKVMVCHCQYNGPYQ